MDDILIPSRGDFGQPQFCFSGENIYPASISQGARSESATTDLTCALGLGDAFSPKFAANKHFLLEKSSEMATFRSSLKCAKQAENKSLEASPIKKGRLKRPFFVRSTLCLGHVVVWVTRATPLGEEKRILISLLCCRETVKRTREYLSSSR